MVAGQNFERVTLTAYFVHLVYSTTKKAGKQSISHPEHLTHEKKPNRDARSK